MEVMDPTTFIHEREGRWRRLEVLLRKIEERGFSSLSLNEVKEFGTLYRMVSSDLVQAKTHLADPSTLDYINTLLLRSYSQLYGPRRFDLKRIWNFFSNEFPALFQKTLPLTLLSAAIFMGAFAMSFIACSFDNDAPMYFMPDQLSSLEECLKDCKRERSFHLGLAPAISSFIMTNNIRVTFLAFGGGILFGIGTSLILLYNGIFIGAVSSVFFRTGKGVEFLAFVLPHGVLELPSIFIAGGGGLLLGKALLLPGNLSRRDALIVNGGIGIRLIIGIIPILIIAGLIEGFFSPIDVIPAYAKFTFSLFPAVSLLLYLFKKTTKSSYRV
jgi:uncharacterized membrane protein SpoIIM required for sporulation